MITIRLHCILVILLAMTQSVHAETRTWIAGDGAWDNAANWSDGILPVALDSVVIAADSDIVVQGPTNPIELDVLSVAGLFSSTLVLDPAGPITVATSFLLGGEGVISGSGSLQIAAINTLAGSAITPTGDLTFLTHTDSQGVIAAPLTITSSLDVASHTVTFQSGATLTGPVSIAGGLLTHPVDETNRRFDFEFTPTEQGESQINGHGQILGRAFITSLDATGDFQIGNTIDGDYQFGSGTINTNDNTFIIDAPGGTHDLIATIPTGGHLIAPDIMRSGSLNFQGGTVIANVLDNVFIADWQSGALEVNGRFGLQIGPASRRDFHLANTTDFYVKQNMQIDIANHFSVIGGNSLATAYTLHLHGGSISAESVGFQGFSALDWQSGSLHITGSSGLDLGGSDFPSLHLLIDNNMSLLVDNTLQISRDATLEYRGGTITADLISILDDGLFQIASPYINQATLKLQGVASRMRGQTFTNQGLVTGSGRIFTDFNNTATGELRVPVGNAMYIGGQQNTNAGKIELSGGNSFLTAELEFANEITNLPDTGLFIVSGNSILRFNDGLQNQGSLGIAFADTQIHGDIHNTGAITINGASQALFADDVHNDGSLYISSDSTAVFFGTLDGANGTTGTGAVQIFGDLRPGNSPAAISFGGDLELSPLASLQLEIAGTQLATQYDQVNIAQHFSRGGALDIQFSPDFTPYPGAQFNLVNFDTTSGAFNSNPSLGQLDNVTLFLDEQEHSLDLIAALPGDFNLDGRVSIADLIVWAQGFGQTNVTFHNGDATLDGIIAIADLIVWAQSFGQTNQNFAPLAPPIPLTAIASATAIPEPSSALLFAFAALALVRRPRAH